MTPAYHISYRNEIVESQGRLFGRFQIGHPEADGMDFMTAYLRSGVRGRLDSAPAVLANMNAAELLAAFLSESRYTLVPGRPVDPFAADWLGQFYAYCQWATGETSRALVERLPVSAMCAAYPGLHDLDLALAVERMGGLRPT